MTLSPSSPGRIDESYSEQTKLILAHEQKSVEQFLQEFVLLLRENGERCAILDPSLPQLDAVLVGADSF
jgi:hypothetical protein